MRRVVVSGLGTVSAAGLNVSESWQRVLSGKSAVRRITAFDPSDFSVQIAAEVSDFDPATVLDLKEARKVSRFIALALAAVKESIIDSGLDLTKDTTNYGSSIGVGIGGISLIEENAITLLQKGPRRVSPFLIPHCIANMAAGMAANSFNLKGPNICTATACTSATHAIGEAWLYIRNNMADVMICGGSESTINPLALAGFANMKALSKRNEQPELASRPFDKDRDGFVMGEGAGILVLEEYNHAKARGAKIYGEIFGYGMSADAYHITQPAKDGEGAQRSMLQALRTAELKPDDVQYINAHGTSTYYNDVYESIAIEKVFGRHAAKLAISSTKGVTGHCLGGAGGIEAVFLAKSIETGTVPPTANLDEKDPECHLDYVPKNARDLKIRYGLSNSFGFGGTNATIIMGKV